MVNEKYGLKTTVVFLSIFIIKLCSQDLKTILLFYINVSTKQVIPPLAVLVKPSMITLSKFYNSVPLLQRHFPSIVSFPPGKMTRGNKPLQERYIAISPQQPVFPHRKMTIQQDFPPENQLFSGISPQKNGYVVGFTHERMTTQQSPFENGLNIQLSYSVKFHCHLQVPHLVDYQCRWVYQPSSLYMDDSND